MTQNKPLTEPRPSDIILERDAFEYAVIHFRNSEESFHAALKSAIQAYLFEADDKLEMAQADIEYWKQCAQFGSLSGKVSLESEITRLNIDNKFLLEDRDRYAAKLEIALKALSDIMANAGNKSFMLAIANNTLKKLAEEK